MADTPSHRFILLFLLTPHLREKHALASGRVAEIRRAWFSVIAEDRGESAVSADRVTGVCGAQFFVVADFFCARADAIPAQVVRRAEVSI